MIAGIKTAVVIGNFRLPVVDVPDLSHHTDERINFNWRFGKFENRRKHIARMQLIGRAACESLLQQAIEFGPELGKIERLCRLKARLTPALITAVNRFVFTLPERQSPIMCENVFEP